MNYYNVQLIKKEDNTPTEWYGGSSAELTTYPENSTFANRDFLWRLGYAKINIPESTFSRLSGVSRHLMVTSGKLQLTHKEHYTKTLSELDIDSFSGDFHTTTCGKCSVFNLMTRENYKGKLFPLSIHTKRTQSFSHTVAYNEEIAAICLYPIAGKIETAINNNIYKVNTGDLLRIDCIECNSSVSLGFSSASSETCKLIISLIYISDK